LIDGMTKAMADNSALGRAIRFIVRLANRRPGASERCDDCGRHVDLRRAVLLNGRFHCDRCAQGFRVSGSPTRNHH